MAVVAGSDAQLAGRLRMRPKPLTEGFEVLANRGLFHGDKFSRESASRSSRPSRKTKGRRTGTFASMDPYVFERCFVRLAEQMAEDRKMTHSDLARAAFGQEVESPVNKWRRIRNKSKLKPQYLNIVEAIRVAQALGVDFPSLCWRVAEQTKHEDCPLSAGQQGRASA